jgi:TolB protein
MAQDGAVSSSFETPMEWNGVDWVSVWEWRPPEAAIPGDRYELTCQVKDPAGAVVEDNFGAAGLVEVTGVGEIVFDSSRDGNREIFTMNADGSNLVNLTNHPAWDHMPCWSPDGSRIAFVSNRLGPQAIFVMYADGTGVKQVSAPSSGVSLPDWSPDGTRIVYSTNSLDPVPASYIVNADGSDLHPPIPALHVFTTSDDFIRNSWHPNGNLLCVNTRDDSVGVGTDIFTMQPDGSNVTNITNTAGFDSMPRWSPGGTRLVWNSDRAPHDGNHEIYVSEFDGVNLVAPQRITDNPNADVQPSWSPDSQKVLWVRKDGGPMSSTGDIYIADLDGSDVRQLTTHASLDDFPSWRP